MLNVNEIEISSKKFVGIPELLATFPTEKDCINHLINMRWKGNPTCPYCNHNKVYIFKDNKKMKCAKCRKIFSVRVGTIFEDSNISLQKWFVAIYLETSHKKGLSSYQLGRDIHVTQKSAWFMQMRIREMMRNKSPKKLAQIVQMDETYIGAPEKNKHESKKTPNAQGRSLKDKTAVVGLLQQGGKGVITRVVKDTKANTLKPIIEEMVKEGSVIITDEWRSYNVIHFMKGNYNHIKINHSTGEYARGAFNTNQIENFWSHVKRGIFGINHHVSPTHLSKYLSGYEYRYNTRDIKDHERFDLALQRSEGRLEYKKLVKKINVY